MDNSWIFYIGAAIVFSTLIFIFISIIKSKKQQDNDDGIIRPWDELLREKIDEQNDKRARRAIKEQLEEEKKKGK